ncbi:hypothetical protein RSAG8_04605, partial [Rhizoctonia solani AG-8 WAC10335]
MRLAITYGSDIALG